MDRIRTNKPIDQDEKFLNALAEAYRLQEAIISATELSIISTDKEGIITSFNRAAERLLGYRAEEVVGTLTPIAFHDLDEVIEHAHKLSEEYKIPVEPGFDCLVIRATQTKKADKREWTFIRKDGNRFPVVLSITTLWDDNEMLIGYAGIASDISEQKIAHERLQESEAHLQALVSSMEDIVYEVDENGRYLNVWAKSNAYTSLSKEEILGKTLAGLYGEKFAKPFDEIRQQVLKTGETLDMEYKSLVDGDERWFNAKYSPILDRETDQKKISVSVRDITDWKKAEFALKDSEQRFRLLAENVPGVIYLCNNDSDFSMLYLNDKVLEVTGYAKEDFLEGRVHFSHLYHPDDRENIYAQVERAIKEKKSFRITYRIKHRSGEWRWLEEYGIGVYSDQQLLWLEGFLSDITSRKKAEDELVRVSTENLRVFNNILNMNVVADFEGRFTKLNPAWEKTLGWSIEELLSRPFADFVHPDDIKRTIVTYESVKSGRDVASFENRYLCKDGTYRWLLWTASADLKGNHVYASALDITDRKKAEEDLLHSKSNVESIVHKLQEQNYQLDEFAHIISHNLRSPVGNIQALLSFLNDNSSIEDFKLIFSKLKNTSKNLSETMNELMDTLQVQKNTNIGKVELRFKDVLDKVVQSLEGNLIQCGASVTFDFKQAPEIKYPKTYLESIIQNLLSNAVKYRSPERQLKVHFSTEIEDKGIILKVSDNGLGIDMEKYGDKLFGMHKTFHDHAEARGVGLFLTKTQVETLGGQISAVSEVDKGTTFVIRFLTLEGR
jgi:PAS domain S-box-containing protein